VTPTQEMMEDNNYNIWSASLWHGKNHNTMKTYYIKSKRQTNLIWTTCRKNCFRYLKPMSPLNAAICTTISYTLWVEWYYLKKIIWPWGQRSRSHKSHYGTRHTTLWSCTHIPNIIDLSRKTKMLLPGQENTIQKTIIWPWGQRSRSHEGHYGMWHTALWSCTHIPNIIDLSGKTKKLWSGETSLRRSRSGRSKNQTKTICLPSFEGEA
jgi:hypothetical protein